MKEFLTAVLASALVGGYAYGAVALGILIGTHASYPYAFAAVFGYAVAAILFPVFIGIQANDK